MSEAREVAESYRSLSQFCATIVSGLFVAAGIFASIGMGALTTGISLMRTSLGVSSMQGLNSSTSTNVTKALAKASVSVVDYADLAFLFLSLNLLAAFIIAGFGYYYWRKSHRIIKGNLGIKSEDI